MGRMFRILTDRHHDQAGGSRPPAGAYLIADAVPYVEVGGPDGVVTSIAAPAKAVVRESVAAPAVMPPVHDYLSVRFHHPHAAPVVVASDVAREVVAFHHPDHLVSSEYRTVRDEIRHQMTEIGSKALYFTAAKTHAGTTTVLLNLAATFANESAEAKVIVVDADFDTPAGAKRLAAGEHHGLADVLGQSVPLAWAIQPSGVPRVQVLSAGIGDLKPAAATDLPRLIGQLRQWFDWILIDGGRWGQRGDRDGCVAACDATYLVARADDLERIEFGTLRNAVAHVGGSLRGSITTKA
jgi:Mrp family chromosome partitioning ATPase